MRFTEINGKKLLAFCFTIAMFCGTAQYHEAIGQTTGDTEQKPALTAAEIKTSYEGGVFGLERKSKGVLKFDDAAQAVNFNNKKSTIAISLDYSWIRAATVTTRKYTPMWVGAAGAAENYVPGAGLVASKLIRGKDHYLHILYQDPDTGIFGVAVFKFGKPTNAQEALNQVVVNAALVPRDSIFVRRNNLRAQLRAAQK
jgi:hypothetical protein